jgi:cyclin-dependent kinase-like
MNILYKIIIIFSKGYSSDIDVIERELKILQSLRFENVVELIEWFRDKKQCFLIFEYVEWNMLQVLQQHPEGLLIEQVRQLSYQLFSAIHWCHKNEIIHRDIKPENLLISKNFTLKLCDFGFARFCNRQASADYYTDYVRHLFERFTFLLSGNLRLQHDGIEHQNYLSGII